MFANISVQAGKEAYTLIKEGAFDPSMISTIPAASGGPKFLVLTGLDRILFTKWFSKRKTPLDWVGSSIGAWRGTALAQSDPMGALDKLEDAYIHQQYTSANPTAAEITRVAWDIMEHYVPENTISSILSSPLLNLHIITAESRGIGKSDRTALLALHCAGAALGNSINRTLTSLFFSRRIYSTKGNRPICFLQTSDFSTTCHSLTSRNIKEIVIASGSIPLAMKGVILKNGITLRDGGIIDYHFDLPFSANPGLTLYPHYSNRIIPGWFDKNLPWKHASRKNHSKTILVSPSQHFIHRLPNRKIPDRRDFIYYKNRTNERCADWIRVVHESRTLGEEFMEAYEGGKLKDIVTRL